MENIATLIELGKQLERLTKTSDPVYTKKLLEWVRAGGLDNMSTTVDTFLTRSLVTPPKETKSTGLPIDKLTRLEDWLQAHALETEEVYLFFSQDDDHSDMHQAFSLVNNLAFVVDTIKAYYTELVNAAYHNKELVTVEPVKTTDTSLTVDMNAGWGSHHQVGTFVFHGTTQQVQDLLARLKQDTNTKTYIK